MSTTARKKMDWKRILVELLSTHGELNAETLSAALIARGQHALESSDRLEIDAMLRQKSTHQLQEAALYPGFKRLRARLEEAANTLLESGQRANVAERAIVEVLHARDLCVIKSHALLSLGLADLSLYVDRHLGELDAFIGTHPLALESVSASKEGALKATTLGQHSVWNQVPDFEDVEPALNESGALSELLSEEDLALVAMGMADDVLERRVSLVIQQQPHVRELYDAILADLNALESEPPAHVSLPVSQLLTRGVHSARPAPQKLAASEQEFPRYEEPSDDDEIFVFADDSQLFVQRRSGGWVIFLYRHVPREDDVILGPGVERIWTEGRLLGAEVKPGKLSIRCNGQQQSFWLDTSSG